MAVVCGLIVLNIVLLFFCPSCLSQHPHSLALLQFKNSFTKSDALFNWKDDGSNPCDPNNVWVGIICSNGIISTINLSGMDLEGQPNIGVLEAIESLKAISIENNSISGPMPEINRLRSLKAFYGGSNWFSGVIPSDFFQTLGSLKKLWLQHNNFSGQIPKSIGELPNLKELHLEYNDFTGHIPPFPEADILTTLNLSNNKLQGEIPKSLHKFDNRVFENNAELCGSKLGKECKKPSNQVPNSEEPVSESRSSTKWIIMIVVVAMLILIILARATHVEQDNRRWGKGHIDEAVVNIPTVTKKTTTAPPNSTNSQNNSNNNSSSSSGTATGTSNNNNANNKENKDASQKGVAQTGRSVAGPLPGKSVGDLVMVNEERGVFGLQDLMKAAAEVLGNGGLGSAYKATLASGVSVVVKRIREMNQMTKDVFDAEMKKLAKLRHKNILTPLAYHFRKEEKLLVSEYVARGSLLYVLHGDRGNSHAELTWPNRLKIIKGVARGMGFLHSEFSSYPLPHGNLKSSNVLIGSDYEPLLSDYAFHPLLNSTPTAQCMFAFKSPEATLNQQVTQKSDVYCMGIIILEIITGKYPSQYMNNQKGGTDVVQWVKSALAEKREKELIDPDISSGGSTSEMEKLLHIGAACTESDPDERMDLKQAIKRIEELSSEVCGKQKMSGSNNEHEFCSSVNKMNCAKDAKVIDIDDQLLMLIKRQVKTELMLEEKFRDLCEEVSNFVKLIQDEVKEVERLSCKDVAKEIVRLLRRV
ncbi:pollen receptor-like kinase 3 [Tanacetum coccineum]